MGSGLPYRVRIKERAVKEALVQQLKRSGVDLDEVIDWLWDDFGRKARRDWKSIENVILGDNDITPQDLAVFMIDQGILPDEGAWSVEPARGLPGGRGRVKGGRE